MLDLFLSTRCYETCRRELNLYNLKNNELSKCNVSAVTSRSTLLLVCNIICLYYIKMNPCVCISHIVLYFISKLFKLSMQCIVCLSIWEKLIKQCRLNCMTLMLQSTLIRGLTYHFNNKNHSLV